MCVHHFAFDVGISPGIRAVLTQGDTGVAIFFVISGFIVPFSMHRTGYELRAFPRFVARRIIRLDPPYLVTTAFAVPLALIASSVPAFRGPPYDITPIDGLLHLGYANAFFGRPWIVGVFWTLAVEFQFYILMGLLLPTLQRGGAASAACVGVMIVMPLFGIAPVAHLPAHLAVFATGILTFLHMTRMCPAAVYWPSLALTCAAIAATMPAVAALACFAAAAMISTISIPRIRPIAMLATVSYSLYLVHVPLGTRIVHLAGRLPDNAWVAWGSMALALAVSLTAAAMLYSFVERPALRLAGTIGYRAHSSPVSARA